MLLQSQNKVIHLSLIVLKVKIKEWIKNIKFKMIFVILRNTNKNRKKVQLKVRKK